jgi:hypothetical protein
MEILSHVLSWKLDMTIEMWIQNKKMIKIYLR